MQFTNEKNDYFRGKMGAERGEHRLQLGSSSRAEKSRSRMLQNSRLSALE
jgi:hypothetical protein